ncbi:MAG: hypothetical protein ACRD9Q_03265, partial [Nitrososphaeraceae archaeon]
INIYNPAIEKVIAVNNNINPKANAKPPLFNILPESGDVFFKFISGDIEKPIAKMSTYMENMKIPLTARLKLEPSVRKISAPASTTDDACKISFLVMVSSIPM